MLVGVAAVIARQALVAEEAAADAVADLRDVESSHKNTDLRRDGVQHILVKGHHDPFQCRLWLERKGASISGVVKVGPQ